MVNRVPAGSSAGGEFTHSADGKTNIPTAAAIRLQEAKNAEAEDANAHPLKFIFIDTEEVCDMYGHTEEDHDSNGSYWKHTWDSTYIIDGSLAERIRNRMHVSTNEPVYYIESQVQSGYSEYTQEHNFGFTVKVGDVVESFGLGFNKSRPHTLESQANGLLELLQWLQEGELGAEAHEVAELLGASKGLKEKFLDYFRNKNY